MDRFSGVQDREARLGTRFVFWMAKRWLHRVPRGMRVRALDPKLLRASVKMDFYGASQRLVPVQLKELAQLKVAMMVGCPF